MRDETVDRRIDLGTLDADVPQEVVVEFAEACNGGAMDEIARDPIPPGAEKPRECAGLPRDLGPNDRCKGCRHSGLPWLLRGNATPPSAPALAERARSLTAEIFAVPGTIELMRTKWSDIYLGASTTLNSVQ